MSHESARRTRPAALLLAALVLALAVSAAGAQVTPNGDQFQVNDYTSSFQIYPAVATDPSGSFVVTWSSWGSPGNDSSYTSIQAQRLAVDGTAVGAQFQVNAFTPLLQMEPEVDCGDTGTFVIAWTSFGSPGADLDESVQAQRFDGGGPLGGQFQVNTYTAGTQYAVDLTTVLGGGFVVTWASEGSSGSDTSFSSVQGQAFDANGLPQGGEFQINTYTTSSQGVPSIDADAGGGFVVAWRSDGSDGSDTSLSSIQARIFDAAGSPLGPDFQVNTYTTGLQDRPRVAFGASGDFVVVWQSVGSEGTDTSAESIQARAFDGNGVALGEQFQVNQYTAGIQERPVVAPDPRGFVVSWKSDGSDGGDLELGSVQVRVFAWDGTPLSDEFQVNSYTTSMQNEPSVTTDAYGDFMVVWQSTGSPGTDVSSTSVQARRFDGLFRDGFESGDTSRWTSAVP